MPIPAVVQDVATVPEALRSEYVPITEGPKKGWFRANVTPGEGFALEDVSGLKGALATERTSRAEAETKLKLWDGLDAKEVRTVLERHKEITNWTPDAKTQELLRTEVGKVKAAAETETTALKGRLSRRDQQVQKLAIRSEAAAELAKLKPLDGTVDLLMPHIEKYARVKEDDATGDLSVVIVGDDGKTEQITTGKGTGSMGLAEFIATLPGKFPGAFAGTAPRGSGMSGGAGGATGQQHTISADDARIPAKYNAAQAAAKAAGVTLQIIE